VVAARLVEAGRGSVLLIEAGPDYGPKEGGDWPADLLDASALPLSHDWGYGSATTIPGRELTFGRAKVIGGCSTHNGCAQMPGVRADYERWVELGCEGWGPQALAPRFAAAEETLRVRAYPDEELTPFQALFQNAAPELGIPRSDRLNDLDEAIGVGSEALNIIDGVRQNTAFAYLDPVRDHPALTVLGECLVDRLLLVGDRVTGLAAIHRGEPVEIGCEELFLCGGTYGSPAVLQRSGIGDPRALEPLGIAAKLDLAGVGANLHDHPMVLVELAGSDRLREAMDAWDVERWTPEEQVMIHARSSHAAPEDPLDLQVYPVSHRDEDGFVWRAGIACMTPAARGEVRILDRGADSRLHIDHDFLGDLEGHDAAVLTDGIELLRRLVATDTVAGWLGEDVVPGPAVAGPAALRRWVGRSVKHYWHPVGTCRMGAADDPLAVVDPTGRVCGTANAYVADCAVMPVIPRATTALPTVVVAEHIAAMAVAG
jgi:choline dehydrogenase